MALPSQHAGAGRSRSNMYRRARHRGIRRLAGVIGAAAVVAAVVWWLRPTDEPGGAVAGDSLAADAAPDLAGGGSPAAVPTGTALGRPESRTRQPGRPAREPSDGAAPAGAGAAGSDPRATPGTDPDASRATPPPDGPERPATAATGPAPAAAATAPRPAVNGDLRPEVRAILERLTDPSRSPLAPREQLSRMLFDGELSPAEAVQVRAALSGVNRDLVFGPVVLPGDPHVAEYRIRSGDVLSRLPRRLGWEVGWRIVAEVSAVRDPARLQVGQRIKGLVGPFHAVVTKRGHRLDLWMGDLAVAPIYVTSWPVGLGADDGTPIGRWRVRSKDLNPAWVNPETGERFSRDDPLNPIGEAWIGLRGIDPMNRDRLGYGIHGTIEPESIGADASLGCVRLHHEDVIRLHELLGDESLIVIRTEEHEPIVVP